MKRFVMLTMAMCVVAMGAVGADTYPRQSGFQILRYSFDVTLSDANNEVVVSDTVSVQFTADGVTGIDLDLCGVKPQRTAGAIPDPCMGARAGGTSASGGGLSGAANESVAPTGMTVSTVTADGKPLRFTHQNDRLHVDFPGTSKAGERFAFTASYRGTPATGLQIGNNRHGDRGFFSNDWPQLARNWLATIDHPSVKAATSMSVTAPRKYQVISNGRLVEEMDLAGDLRKTTWREDAPIASWLISLGAAPFAVTHFGEFRGIPMSAWVYPQDRDESFQGFVGATQPILEFYIDHIGPYAYEKLAHVEATTVGGGMELASSIFYGYRGVPGRQLIAHEMAHQWFGDAVTESDWNDVWLSEGFATYFALLYLEHADGREAFVSAVKSSAQNAMRFALANPTVPIVHKNLTDVSKVLGNHVYQGGAQALHMLRGLVGDTNFWAGVRLYYQRHRNAHATTADFRRAMQDACMDAGNCPAEYKDLSWFFDEWLHRGGALGLHADWFYDADARQVIVNLEQRSEIYRMPIDIRVTSEPAPAGSATPATGRGAAAGPTSTITRVTIDKARHTFTFPSATNVTDVQLDPNSWVTLMTSTVEKRAKK